MPLCSAFVNIKHLFKKVYIYFNEIVNEDINFIINLVFITYRSDVLICYILI